MGAGPFLHSAEVRPLREIRETHKIRVLHCRQAAAHCNRKLTRQANQGVRLDVGNDVLQVLQKQGMYRGGANFQKQMRNSDS